MEINGKNYSEIEEKFFIGGMYCNSDVYIAVKGKPPVLLCSKSVVNDKFLKRLHHIYDFGTKLYVEKDAIENLQEQYSYLTGADQELCKKFSDMREKFGRIMEEVERTSKVNTGMVLPMVLSLDVSVKKMDLSFLLQWTSYMRDMDKYLQTHCTNVAIIDGKLAEWLGMNDEQIKKAIMIGLLHDLGKTRIPTFILDKPGKLTPEEFDMVKLHPIYSWEIVKASGISDPEILAGVRGHHEKINGTGYPDCLKMDEISPFAMISEIADIYDAMVAQRVYKESSTPFEVLDDFYKMQFAELNPNMVAVFLKAMKSELIGKNVILSNGKIATICYIEEGKFLYPMVKIGEEVIQLNKDLWCVTLCTKTGII